MSSRSSDPASPPTAEAEALAESVSAAVDAAIATDLAPAVAVALLAKSDHEEESAPPAMECISAGVSSPNGAGLIRIQFMFENGTILPIELPVAAGEALAKALLSEVRGRSA
jgi:hypothetical protein